MYNLLLSAALALSPVTLTGTNSESQWVAFNRAGAENSRMQCFTSNNVGIENGYLVITTKAEAADCSSFDLLNETRPYTSGFVSMRQFSFLYGVLEFRAKFGGGSGSGAWPAVWLADASCQASDPTGTDDRCNEQEIDVAEIMKSDFTHVNQQIHVDRFSHNDGCSALASDTSQNFHVYQLAWSPGLLEFVIDGVKTCTIAKPYVPSAPMYVKIDVYVGSMGGPVKATSLPWTTLVDYVKVTQGSTVLFSEDFNAGTKILPGPAARNTVSSVYRIGLVRIRTMRLPWMLLSLVVILILVGTAIAVRRARI